MSSDLRIRRLLAAVDFDATAPATLTHAGAWANYFNAALTVLHVRAGTSEDDPEAADAPAELDALIAAHVPADVAVTPLVREGAAASAVAEVAVAVDADVVIMGSHRRGPVGRWLLGSVATDVLHRLDVPVLLVKGPGAFIAGGTLVAAADLSEATGAVVGYAARLAAATGASLHLVHALPIGDHESPGHVVMRDRATGDLDALRARLVPAAIETTQRVVMRMEAPAKAIADDAHEVGARLLVVGAHGETGLSRRLLGNITQRVLHETGLPVLVVRPPARKET